MKKMVWFVVMVVLFVLSLVVLEAYAVDLAQPSKTQLKKTVIEIDYGGIHPSRTIEVRLAKASTVLELLQNVAEVKTHPVGGYVMVVSIDGVEGKRGEMAWYYTVDGKSPGKVANSNVLNGEHRIKWIYKKDVCSSKVDKK